ncbi:hypothetical protein ACNPIS_28585 [Paenibacillus apiarius]
MYIIRIVWVGAVILLMYQDKPDFAFWPVLVSLLACHTIPFFL